MNIELIRYSQDVSVDNRDVTSFLVFRKNGGDEFRVRVSDETIKDLVLKLGEDEAPISKDKPTIRVSDDVMVGNDELDKDDLDDDDESSFDAGDTTNFGLDSL